MKVGKKKGEGGGNVGSQRSWDDPFPVVKEDFLIKGLVPCAECEEWHLVELHYKWERRMSRHGEPTMGRLVHSEHGVTVVEGKDTLGPLCRSCFAEASDAVVKAALKAAGEEKKAEKIALKKRLTALARRQEKEQKVVATEIAEIEAALAAKEVA